MKQSSENTTRELSSFVLIGKSLSAYRDEMSIKKFVGGMFFEKIINEK